jgi:hypothetical protein
MKVLELPESSMGAHTVALILHDRRVIDDVKIAWGRQIISVGGKEPHDLPLDQIASVVDRSQSARRAAPAFLSTRLRLAPRNAGANRHPCVLSFDRHCWPGFRPVLTMILLKHKGTVYGTVQRSEFVPSVSRVRTRGDRHEPDDDPLRSSS